ncbi:MAG: phospholipase D-like domain-containing protein, partial [Polyangia bacterium]
MDGLYTNRSANRDFAHNAFARYGQSCDVLVASAFFSAADTIAALLEHGCRVQLVVRLGAATSPAHLKRVLGRPGVQVRYFTDRSFHPKLYIFGAACALVGSANFTGAGMTTNQEIVVAIGPDDPRFDELVRLFGAYWDEAKVLSEDSLTRFAEVLRRNSAQPDDRVDSAVIEALGRHTFANIEWGLPKVGRRQEFLDAYRRRYQSFRDAYDLVCRVYKSLGRRITVPPFPLRLEIDQYFSFIREVYALGDSYYSAPLLTGPEQEARIYHLIEEFVDRG